VSLTLPLFVWAGDSTTFRSLEAAQGVSTPEGICTFYLKCMLNNLKMLEKYK
jgi:hypothetical protein